MSQERERNRLQPHHYNNTVTIESDFFTPNDRNYIDELVSDYLEIDKPNHLLEGWDFSITVNYNYTYPKS